MRSGGDGGDDAHFHHAGLLLDRSDHFPRNWFVNSVTASKRIRCCLLLWWLMLLIGVLLLLFLSGGIEKVWMEIPAKHHRIHLLLLHAQLFPCPLTPRMIRHRKRESSSLLFITIKEITLSFQLAHFSCQKFVEICDCDPKNVSPWLSIFAIANYH